MLQLQLLDRGEVVVILGVGAGPAALREVHAQLVQGLGDLQLVGEAEVHALPLVAVAQGGVVDLYALPRHARPRA